jgi:hypothetical protein
MDDELERICKEAVLTESRYCPSIYLAELRNTTRKLVGIADVPVEMLVDHLPNTRVEHYL